MPVGLCEPGPSRAIWYLVTCLVTQAGWKLPVLWPMTMTLKDSPPAM